MQLDPEDIHAYYRSALLALQALEAQRPTGRRFGPDADARWSGLKGSLTTADRIDLMIRDADAQWPRSLGARTVFNAADVAEDDAFGARWPGLLPVKAEELWRTVTRESVAASTVRQALENVATTWNHTLQSVDLPEIHPADALVVAGPSAVAALAVHFSEKDTFDWSAQVTVVATPPAHRQLAAVTAALLNATKALPLHANNEGASSKSGAKLVTSPDAAPQDLARAHELTAA